MSTWLVERAELQTKKIHPAIRRVLPAKLTASLTLSPRRRYNEERLEALPHSRTPGNFRLPHEMPGSGDLGW